MSARLQLYSADGERAARRNELFVESTFERCERVTLAAAYALKPARIGSLPKLTRLWLGDMISPPRTLPDVNDACRFTGLCGIARDLSVPSLLAAYKQGLFPGGHTAPTKWYSPAERCVLFFDNIRIEKTVRRLLRKRAYRVTFDRDFDGVIKACAERRPGKWHVTWITPQIMHAYAALHDAGHAHSFEVWNDAGDLVGGGYGVAIGGAFFGESQFSRERNTSKIGQAVLGWHLAKWGFTFDDSKWPAPTLLNMGFRPIPRDEFVALTRQATQQPTKCDAWEVECDPAVIADWQPAGSIEATEAATAAGLALTPKKAIIRRVFIPLLPAFDHATIGLGETMLRLV
jgi:leucyl/phenylalanyl-tRNA--protein transferase